MSEDTRRRLVFGLLVLVILGTSWALALVAGGDGATTAPATAKGLTQDQLDGIVQVVQGAAAATATAAGQPQWIPVVDMVIKCLALVFAWFIRPKPPKAKPPG